MTMQPPQDLPHPLQGELFDDEVVPPTFPKELEAFKKGIIENERLRRAREDYLEEISADTKGTDPADFLSQEHAAVCRDFVKFAIHAVRRHPVQEELTLQTAISGEKLWSVETKGATVVRNYPGLILKGNFFHRGDVDPRYEPIPLVTRWSGNGFYIGEIRGPGNPGGSILPAYLCTDGKMRCQRTPEIFPESYGVGFGTVPEGLQFTPGTVSWEINEEGRAIIKNHYPASLDVILINYANWYPNNPVS